MWAWALMSSDTNHLFFGINSKRASFQAKEAVMKGRAFSLQAARSHQIH